MRKRALSALLAFCMALTLLPGTALASEADGKIALTAGCHEKWIDRLDLPDYAKNLYSVLEEAADGDGVNDYLIDDKYANLKASDVIPLEDLAQANVQIGDYVKVHLTTTSGPMTMGGILVDTRQSATNNETQYCYNCISLAENAFDRDHAEVFWRKGTGVAYSVGYGGQRYYFSLLYYEYGDQGIRAIAEDEEVFPAPEFFFTTGSHAPESAIQLLDDKPKDYTNRNTDESGNLYTEASIKATIAERDRLVQNIIGTIQGTTRYDQVKGLNLWLTQHNVYNSIVADADPDSDNAGASKTAWECISALRGRSGAIGPVCQGYTKAFHVLCDELGIPCVDTFGNIRNDPDAYHTWNYVQMDDGIWYGVDVTWNDVGDDDYNPYLLVYNEQIVDNGITFIKHHPATNRLYYSIGEQETTLDVRNGPEEGPNAAKGPYTPGAHQPTDISTAVVTVTPASMEYTGSALEPAVTVTLNGAALRAGTDYTVSYSNNTEVGTATVTITGRGLYSGTAVKTFTITAKAKTTPALTAADITAVEGSTLTITGTAKDGDKDVEGTWSFVDAAPTAVGKHENVKVKFVPKDAETYNEAETTITVTITAKPAEKVTPALTAADITAVEGSTLTITGTAKDGDKDVEGTWSFVDAAPTAVGKHENVKVKFVPKDAETYNEAETTITVTITAKPAEKVTPVLTAENITAVVGSELVITGTAKDGDKVVEGTWSFVGAAPTAVGTYRGVKVKFVPADTAAYNEAETAITVTITPAPVEPVAPTVTVQDITVDYTGTPVADSAIRGTANVPGRWSFVGAVPTAVGVHTVTVRFTPSNTVNYLTVEKAITLTINRASQALVITSPAVVRYDSRLTLTTNSPAGLVTYTVTDGTGRAEIAGDVLTPLAVGTVTVTANRAATETLDAASATQVITIEPVPVDQIDVPSGSYPDLIITDGRASSFAVDVTRAMTYRHLYETLFNRGELRLARTGADMSMSLEEINPYDTYLLEWWPNSTTRLEITVNPRENEENYISINTSDGGGVIPNVRRAETGERVILYVHPEAGYEMDSLTVTDGRGRQISCRSLGNDSYSFSMPASRVNVDVDFVKSQPNAPAEDDIYNQPFTGLGTPGISGIVLNPAAMPFTDVKGPDWFYNYVEYMWKHYLMSGTSETRFDPNVTTSRAMIWTIMARMNNVRTDINPGSTWYEKGMLWAMEKGITDGSNAMGDITREQLATMLWRNAGSPAAGGDLSRFSDAGSVSAYALNAVRWAAGNGILSGINGRIEPQGTATRAQVAAMIARYGDKTVR